MKVENLKPGCPVEIRRIMKSDAYTGEPITIWEPVTFSHWDAGYPVVTLKDGKYLKLHSFQDIRI